MSEGIELRFLNNNNNKSKNESDAEYHEISIDRFLEGTLVTPQTPTKRMKQYNFFTQFDVKSDQKVVKKKKRKKDSRNLMDIISLEIALREPPLVKNVITKINYLDEEASHLNKTPRFSKSFQWNKTWHGDSENGWKNKATNLNPVFPRVLESAIAKDKVISVQYVEPVMFDDIVADYQEYETKQPPKFLEISIKDITFYHHHEFSLEKLLSIKLVDCFKDYNNIHSEIKYALKNIEINKNTRDNLKQQLLNIGSTTKEDLRFDQTVLKYTGKFLQLKDKYYQLLNAEKEARHKVMSLWADIEAVRQKSETTDTAYFIELTETVLTDDDYEKELANIFEIEYSDMLDRLEYEYVIKYLEYKKFKQSFMAGDSQKTKILKPKLNIDQENLKDEVENIVNKIVTKHRTEILLKENKHILRDLSNNGTAKHTYNFKIYVDNVFVCESETVSPKFLFNWIDIEDTLSIQILPNNEKISIFLCENDIKVAALTINISEVRRDCSNTNFRTEMFIYNNTIEPTARFIGSGFEIKEILAKIGVRLKSCSMFKGKLYTTANVDVKVGWSDQLMDNNCDSIQRSMYIGSQLKQLMLGNHKPNVGILTDIIEKIYGRNIDNDINIKNALQDACKGSIHKDIMFTIDADCHETNRLKLLHLRNCGRFDEVVDKIIPIFPSQISTEQLTCLQRSEEKAFDVQLLQDNVEIDAIDMQRFMSVKYVEKLNAKLQKNLSDCLLKKTYKDVVRDFKDLTLRSIFSNDSNFELESLSNTAEQNILRECLTKDQEISIVVSRAFNLLDRSTTLLSEELEDRDSIAGFKVRPLRPFVRISYRGVSAQTSTSIGCYPTWNSTVKIKTKFSPLSTIYVNVYDECKVDVSEAYPEEAHSSLTRAVHYRYYNKWLGAVQIPLYAVLRMGSLQGSFKIASPPLIFGYDTLEVRETKSVVPEVVQLMMKDSSFLTLQITTNLCNLGGFQGYTQPVPSSENDVIISHLNTFVTEYLNEFPSRNISLTFIDSFGRNKCVTEFLQSVTLPDSKWFPRSPKSTDSAISKSSSSKSSRKKLSLSINGEDRESNGSVSDNLWKGSESKVDSVSKLVDAALRYVALIPTHEISNSHVVTLSGTELLNVLYGSHLDHTLLLASYYLHLGIRCWVATGAALPRGLSSYVLVKYEQMNKIVMLNGVQKRNGFLVSDRKQFTWIVYDAVSGERFQLRDASCPLKTVSYVFDSENIWVNIQKSQNCESVSFDFSKSSDWQQVFEDPYFIMKLPPASTDKLYSVPPDVEQLRSKLENKVKCKVQKWRSHMKTIWNRYCGSLLREMLPRWEYWAFNPTEPRPMPGPRLKQLMITYKMFGFPLNVPYVNAKSVISSVKSTGIHLNDDLSVEFGLAVDVFAYPNNVLSVWVFLASITRV